MSSKRWNSALPDEPPRKQLLQRNITVSAGMDMMDRWTLDIDSIIIQSPWVCYGTRFCYAALVVGGLTIGFTVNKRIDGVDPFNISIFCWVMAGFIIIFMKSLRVENWPWRDFFRGRVVCRSVSEVTALSILLRLEPFIMMNKQGPFRAVFVRNDNNTVGFSIDVPLKRESLVDAGCFLIKVQSSNGPALVAIRAVIGHTYNMVEPHAGTFESPGSGVGEKIRGRCTL